MLAQLSGPAMATLVALSLCAGTSALPTLPRSAAASVSSPGAAALLNSPALDSPSTRAGVLALLRNRSRRTSAAASSSASSSSAASSSSPIASTSWADVVAQSRQDAAVSGLPILKKTKEATGLEYLYNPPKPAPRLAALAAGNAVNLTSAGLSRANATSLPAALSSTGLPSPAEPFATSAFAGSPVPLSTALASPVPVVLNGEDEFVAAAVALNSDDEFVYAVPSTAVPTTTEPPASPLVRMRALDSDAAAHATLLPILNVWNPTSTTSKACKPAKSSSSSKAPKPSGSKGKRAASFKPSAAAQSKPMHRRPAAADEAKLKKRVGPVFAKIPNPRKAMLRARDAEARRLAGEKQ